MDKPLDKLRGRVLGELEVGKERQLLSPGRPTSKVQYAEKNVPKHLSTWMVEDPLFEPEPRASR